MQSAHKHKEYMQSAHKHKENNRQRQAAYVRLRMYGEN